MKRPLPVEIRQLRKVQDVATGKEIRRLAAGSVAFSPDGKWFACGKRGETSANVNAGIVVLYDRATGQVVREMRGHLTVIGALAFLPDSKSVLSRGLFSFNARFGNAVAGESETQFL